MKNQVMLRSWAGLLAIAFASALGLTACQQSQEPAAKPQATTTNAAAPTKAPEHPEHPK